MASTAANGINRTSKTNLSVASLINCSTSPKVVSSSPEKVKTSIVTTSMLSAPKNLPTVANSDLLYKNVSSASCSLPPPLAPASPVSATLSVNYTLQQYSNLVGGFRTSTSSNPLSNIKTLTNVVTNPLSKIEVNHQYPSKKSYVEIRPAPIAPVNQIVKSSVISPSINIASSTEKTIGVVTSCNKPPLVVFSTTSLVPTTTVSSTNKLKTIIAKPSQGVQRAEVKAIFVPRGWNRILEKEYITYVR